MKSKMLGWLSLITLISVTLWLIILIWDMATAGPLDLFQQVLAHAEKEDWKFTLTYLNAGIFTVGATALMAGIYSFVKPILPEWSMVGLVFVPIYGTLNLLAYLTQITLVPALLQATSDPVMADTALLLLQQTLPSFSPDELWDFSMDSSLRHLRDSLDHFWSSTHQDRWTHNPELRLAAAAQRNCFHSGEHYPCSRYPLRRRDFLVSPLPHDAWIF